MTHDELLAKINEASPADKIDAGWQSALRAVVELHAPFDGVCQGCIKDECWGCGEWSCNNDCDCSCHAFWPCSTIETIAKEFK